MIPSCPECHSTELEQIEIDGASDKSNKLTRLAFVLLLSSIASFISLYFSFWFIVVALVFFILSLIVFKRVSRIITTRLVCRQCGWVRKE